MGAQWKAKGKELAANAKGKVFGKLAKEIMVAARSGADPSLNARLRLVVGRLNRRVRIDGHESIPPLQLSTLVTVEQHSPLRLSELARREAVTAPTMSRVLAALDEHGLVQRSTDPQDARSVLITLSAEGRRRLEEVRSHRNALIARRLLRLDDAQRATLVSAMPALEALLVDDE
jgi:DNA-binding MarR family transcriptional regulator